MFAWRKAILDLLERTKVRPSHLAEAVGLSRSLTWQHLNGTRNPREEQVRNYNRSLGEMLGDSRVSAYLNSVFDAAENSKDHEAIANAVEGLAVSLQSLLGRYLAPDSTSLIAAEINRLPPEKQLRLFHEINENWRRRIVHAFVGSKERTTDLNSIARIFDKYGIRLGRWHRGGEGRFYVEHMGELFELEVRRTMARVTDDLSERNAAEDRIISKFREVYSQVGAVAIEALERGSVKLSANARKVSKA